MLLKERHLNANPHQVYRIRKLKHHLSLAESYEEWREIGLKLDEETQLNAWKYDNDSPYFDAELVAHRFTLLSRYRLMKRHPELLSLIREGLAHDLGNIGHPMLFSIAHVGTKKLIEDYVQEMSDCLKYVASDEFTWLSTQDKYEFFKSCEVAYGQPALMFSGGATLGLFHSGVCKALLENDLLPQVLSGSSAGAIMAAIIGTSDRQGIEDMIHGDGFFDQAFKFRHWTDIIKGNGGVADVIYLKKFLMENLGDVTFKEAFDKSGRHINIVVAPYDASQSPRIMNAHTAPDLLVWSAVLASCAVPVLFPPVRLTSKRFDGTHTPYMSKTRWVDGSVRSDFPQEKIARLYNINYSIASQVNPHVVPFMQTDEQRYRKDVLSWPNRILRAQGKMIAMGVMDFTRDRMGRLPTVRRLLDHGYGVVDQRYYGDVNIIGKYNWRHYTYMLQNPKPHLFKRLQREGERATWPKLSAIETHARMGKTIQQCIEQLKEKRQLEVTQRFALT